MIKKILHIALILVCSLALNAQVVTPMGVGLDQEPVKIASYENGVAVVAINAQNEIVVDVWNGDFWYSAMNPPLPKAGSNSMGYLEIKDLKSYNNKLYLVAEHTLDLMPSAPNYVLEWDGLKWKTLSSAQLNDALVINELVLMNGNLQLVGKFSDGSTHYNILNYNGTNWSTTGNLITKNVVDDQFVSLAKVDNTTYATGTFSNNTQTYSLVQWDGSVWNNVASPAFADDNETVGTFNNQLVVFGKDNSSPEAIKLRDGTSWTSLNTGLENYSIQNISSFSEANSKLYALGTFVHSTQGTVQLMVYDNGSWDPLELNVNQIENSVSSNDNIIVTGAFVEDERFDHIGLLKPERALIKTKVYHDKNGNCVKDLGEEWLQFYPVHLGEEIDQLLTDQWGQMYASVKKDTFQVNASEVLYFESTCPDEQLIVDEHIAYELPAFGVKKKSNITDLAVTVSDNQSFAHLNAQLKRALVCVNNPGSNDVNAAQLTLKHSNDINNFSSELAYDNYVNSEATWTVDLVASEELCFYIDFTSNSLDEIVIDLNIELSTQDQDESNNSSTLKYKKGESSPNSKHCQNGEAIAEDEAYLNYKISFKNTGYKEALDVVVVDILDDKIVPSAEGIWYLHSHECVALPPEYTVLDNGNWQYKLMWEYSDINLPNSEGTESEGFLDFKVYLHPGTLNLGDEICNKAYIYYSYTEGSFNEPLSTNTVCSEVSDNIIVDSLDHDLGLEIGPIPTDAELQIINHSQNDYSIQLVNAIGQRVLESAVAANATLVLDMNNVPAGVYFVYADGQFAKKVIIH